MSKKAIGHKWGLQPYMSHWLYIAVIRPILLYGVVVWWPILNVGTHLKNLRKVQRQACICISGALRTTPTDALEVLLNLSPLDFFGKQTATICAVRLKACSQWCDYTYGHAKILHEQNLTSIHLDYTSPRNFPENNFETLIPERDLWYGGTIPFGKAIHFYTDGSKTEDGVGSGVFSEHLNLNKSIRLPNHCSVFQAEIMAISEALSWLRWNAISARDICIFTDSQAAIKSLASFSINSKVVIDCRTSLNEMSEQFKISLCWVPGHRDIPGNCKADELAKYATRLPVDGISCNAGSPIATFKLQLNNLYKGKINARWQTGITCKTSKQIWPNLDPKRSNCLISLKRSKISIAVGIITGHCVLGLHAKRLGLFSNDFCRSCLDEEEEENILHLLCNCPALASTRRSTLGSYFYDNLNDLSKTPVTALVKFADKTGWLS